MTRKSKREIERAVADLTDQADGDECVLVIGGDRQKAGVHRWNSDAGAYVNDHGHEIPPGVPSEGLTYR